MTGGLPPEIMLALGYAPSGLRAGFETLLAFDRRLGAGISGVAEVQLARIRLAWWRDEIEAHRPAADPDLVAVQAMIRRHDVTAGQLVRIVEGWAALLEDLPLSAESLRDYARGRGAGLVAAAAALAGSSAPDRAGEAYALADFARKCSDRATREAALALALDAPVEALPRSLRPFALLDAWAHRDAVRMSGGKAPLSLRARAFSALTFALTGPRL